MFPVFSPGIPASQAPPHSQDFTAPFGIGAALAKPLNLRRLPPRERAVTAFILAGMWRDFREPLH
jgi:hypothetical protein